MEKTKDNKDKGLEKSLRKRPVFKIKDFLPGFNFFSDYYARNDQNIYDFDRLGCLEDSAYTIYLGVSTFATAAIPAIIIGLKDYHPN